MHHRSFTALTCLACALAVGTAVADPDHTYLEEEGIVLFEVEDAVPLEGWALKSEVEDFQGGGYFEWTGPDSFPHSSAGKGTVMYHFRIQTPGNYQIRWRNRINHGESNTEANDSWIRLATGVDVPEEQPLDGWTKVYMNTLGSWSWTAKTVDHVGDPIRQYFEQGDHTLEISGRSIGHAIDRIAIFRYEDVNHGSHAMDQWERSRVVTGDGSVVDPTEHETPPPDTDPAEEEITDPETDPDPAPEEPDTTGTAARENLYEADVAWQDVADMSCVDDSLALPAQQAVLVSTAGSEPVWSRGETLTLVADDNALLLHYDLSLVPALTKAVIEYSTGDQAADALLHHALASDSDWTEQEQGTAQPPSVMLALANAEGGWTADTRFQSILPADQLPAQALSLMLTSAAGSDPLTIEALESSELLPRLILGGESGFCDAWQMNVEAANAPVEPSPEVNEQIPDEEPAVDELEPEEPVPDAAPEEPGEETPVANAKSSGGGALSGLVLMLMGWHAVRRFRAAESGSRLT